MAEEINLETKLRPPDANGWRVTPTITLKEGQWVDNPASTKPESNVWGPCRVKLWIAPDRGRTLEVF